MKFTRLFSRTGLILLLTLLCAATLLIDRLLPAARIDLTQDRLYSLSDGSRKLLQSLDKPVHLHLFFSEKESKENPFIRAYAKRVRELIDEYRLASNGKLLLEVIDPEPFSEAEDKAAELGINAIPLQAGGPQIYLGLAAKGENGTTERIPFFSPDREPLLEYDISRMIYTVSRGKRPTVGLISAIDVLGGIDMLRRQPTPPWMAFAQLEQLFEFKQVGNETSELDPKLYDLLVLIHPQQLPPRLEYAIDQYLMRGGKLILFVDPHAERMNQGMMELGDAASNLPALMKSWGVEMVDKKVLLDDGHAINVTVGEEARQVRHPAILALDKSGFDSSDVIMSRLEYVLVSSSGVLKPIEGATTRFTPLMQSSSQSMLIDADKMIGLADPSLLYQGFEPDGQLYTVAARITGPLQSAFPAGPPAEPKPPANAPKAAAEPPAPAAKPLPPHLAASQSDSNILVVADTDLLTDRLWVRVQNFMGQQVGTPFADNGDLIANAVDNLSGNPDLIAIRGRGQFYRPFTRVIALQQQASAHFREKQEQLQASLKETEQKLGALQAQRNGEGEQQKSATLTPEQEATIEQFQQEKLRLRKELRTVQHQLNQEIEQLGTWIKALNILLMPLLITLFALLHRTVKQRRAALR